MSTQTTTILSNNIANHKNAWPFSVSGLVEAGTETKDKIYKPYLEIRITSMDPSMLE